MVFYAARYGLAPCYGRKKGNLVMISDFRCKIAINTVYRNPYRIEIFQGDFMTG